MNETKSRSFPLGQMVITPNARNRLHPQDVFRCLLRHLRGDWENCDDEGAKIDHFSTHFVRFFSVDHDRNGVRLYIPTEKSWIIETAPSVTTISLPEDY